MQGRGERDKDLEEGSTKRERNGTWNFLKGGTATVGKNKSQGGRTKHYRIVRPQKTAAAGAARGGPRISVIRGTAGLQEFGTIEHTIRERSTPIKVGAETKGVDLREGERGEMDRLIQEEVPQAVNPSPSWTFVDSSEPFTVLELLGNKAARTNHLKDQKEEAASESHNRQKRKVKRKDH